MYGHGVGGGVFDGILPFTPTIFHMQCPERVKRETTTISNPTGTLPNSDLEITRLLLLWLVMEEVCDVKSGDHLAVFSYNQLTVL